MAAREEHPEAREHTDRDADPEEEAPVLLVPPPEHVEGPETGHHESPAHHGPAHVVRVLREGPGVEQHRPVVIELDIAVFEGPVADGVLNPGVGGDDEVARSPGAKKDMREENQWTRCPKRSS